MNLPLDIHTHQVPADAYTAIQNRYPETFDEQAEGWFSVGIHPWKITDYQHRYPWQELQHLCSLPQVVAIGEAGLDKLCGVPMDEQEKVFIRQAEMAEELNKPLIIHLVKSADEIIRIRKTLKPAVSWIIHGFRGKPAQAQQLLSHGFCLSFGVQYHPQSMQITPLSKLFLETDEADVDFSSLLQRAAEIKGISIDELQSVLKENVRNAFLL